MAQIQNKNTVQKNRKNQGFSLLEIMVVLVLLGLIITIVGPRITNALFSGQSKAVKIQIKQIEGYLDRYRLDCGRYPTTDQGLRALVQKPSSGCPNWDPSGYAPNKKLPKDPWDHEFVYRCDDGVNYEIISYGQDRQEGEKVRMPISLLKKKSKNLKPTGFTLVEIMLVIVLLSLLATVVVPKVTSVFHVSVQSSVRRFGALVKFAFDQSILTHRVHRIVLDLDNQKWSLEAAPHGAVAGLEIKDRDSDFKVDPNKVLSMPEFSVVKGSLVDRMPPGVEIFDVKLTRKKTVVKGEEDKKIYYIYAYPGGYIDAATVSLVESGSRQGRQIFKISIRSLTGKVKVETTESEGV